MNNLHESVQRWLMHENYSFNEVKTEEDNFKITITDIGRDSGNLEIFEPKQQSNILVIGVKVQLKTGQMMRFLKLNEKQKENLEKKITDFCYSIKAVNKFFYEDGRKKLGINIVLDKKDQLNHPSFTKTLREIMEMSDKTRKFLYMVF